MPLTGTYCFAKLSESLLGKIYCQSNLKFVAHLMSGGNGIHVTEMVGHVTFVEVSHDEFICSLWAVTFTWLNLLTMWHSHVSIHWSCDSVTWLEYSLDPQGWWRSCDWTHWSCDLCGCVTWHEHGGSLQCILIPTVSLPENSTLTVPDGVTTLWWLAGHLPTLGYLTNSSARLVPRQFTSRLGKRWENSMDYIVKVNRYNWFQPL